MALRSHYGASGRCGFGSAGHPRFANAYFVNNGVVWQILDPARMLTALAWSAGASQANVAIAECSESSGDGQHPRRAVGV